MEHQIGAKLAKEYNKAIYFCLPYLTSMQNTSCKMLDWMNHKLETRLLGEISTISNIKMIALLWQIVKKN